jgi:hypothetical protein
MGRWLEIRRFLEHILAGHLERHPEHHNWIIGLETAEDGERLGACLAIDLISEALSPAWVQAVLERLNFRQVDARWAFGVALEEHPEHEQLLMLSGTASASSPDEGYAHVMPVQKFITSYAGPADGYTSLSTDSIAEVKRRYFSEGTGTTLEDIDIWWTGKTGLVWVTSGNDLLSIMSSAAPGQVEATLQNTIGSVRPSPGVASAVKNALGLVRPWILPEGLEYYLIAIQYPLEFPHRCAPPTTLDAYWTHPGQYYLSWHKPDGWGRTHNCLGERPHLRERVHQVFEGLGEGYRAFALGAVKVGPESRPGLLDEAYRRFAEAKPASAPV